ncbi:multiple epidermal growth factor-like domains protein 8 isoform X2 [Homalodisca vitripennis]|nr:multiple epidermal growth factor-like domains protein 8 isoform X2 [Homalodisca vitripennis]
MTGFNDKLDARRLAAVGKWATVGSSDDQWGGLHHRPNFFSTLLFTSAIADNNSRIQKHSEASRHSGRVHRQAGVEEEFTPRRPSPRYAHAACNYPGGFVLYGGVMEDNRLSSELWLYQVVGGRWSLRAQFSTVHPPPLARHTLTLADDGWLYIVGGSTEQGHFSSKIFRIKLTTVGGYEAWEEVVPRGGKELDVRLVAHSTVYNPHANALLVYAGIVANVARFSKLSDRMFSFQLDSRHWAEVHYPRAELPDTYVPRERAFHSATVIGNYLVVFGGYTHRHNREEICYDKQLYLYHLGCHTWVSHDILDNLGNASHYPKVQGIFSHAAALRNGNTLLLFGGYHGNVNADLLAFVMPPTIASRDGEPYEPEQICSRHHSLSACSGDPECGWCSADDVCYGRTLGINCTTNLQTTRCPGVCPALGDCHSCLLHGTTRRDGLHSVVHKLHAGQCTWCVQNARCHHKDDNFGVCGLKEDTPSQVAGWWGDKGAEVMSADVCREVDRRPGLTFLKYKYPANLTHPDSVSIINATTADFNALSVTMSRTEQNLGGEITARLLGFLRPPHTWENAKEQLRICVSHSTATLRLESITSHLEVVANMSADQSSCVAALWPTGAPTVLLPGRYLVDFEARKNITISHYPPVHSHSKMELLHNKTHETPKVFTFEYLEPYEGNGTCSQYTNCLQCLSDSLCGWCEVMRECQPRSNDERTTCLSGPEDWHYLTIVPWQCANCSNFIDCEDCVGSGKCEWWTDDARCARRGRSTNGVVELSACPAPCHSRENCTDCLDGNGRCVWCQATQECFSFAVYTSQYQFGMCREWLDQAYHSPHSLAPRNQASAACNVCGRHANCSSCLRTLGCGWCYDLDNPIQGACVPGDFSQPYVESCSSVVNMRHNMSLYSDEVSWSYAQCPDVDECGLGLHDCHPEAKCTNTHGSYSCQCRRGFIGDGKHSCTKTCYDKCINGYCVGSPQYSCKCDLGWTGSDCGTNCGCNNHSTCAQGVGICDSCHDWTTGEFCQYCKAGSYGNATSPEGCRGCNCNEHGNTALGVCDTVTGVCYCQDNTEGPTCNKCKKGYYGDPRRGGTCYFQCMARGMLTSWEPQGLGSRLAEMSAWESRQGPPSRECLWIISPHDLHNKTEVSSVIQLVIDPDISVTCGDNSVYVYDGLPDFVSMGTHQSQVLGVFCTQDTIYPVTVEARSGMMTVHYKQGDPLEGFNASVTVLTCPDRCPRNRVCRQGACVCPEGTTGPDCSDQLCSNNCTADLKQGFCDKGYGRCLCTEGWGGPQCATRLRANQLVFTELFNSAHLADNLDHLRKMLPRFGHSLLTDRRGSLWLFGGYSLSHGPLNDIRLFDTKNNTWMQVTIDSTNDINMPQGRYFHAAEIVQSKREIFVYGGLTQKETNVPGVSNSTLNDFWKFSLKNQRWIDIQTATAPPPLAGHTLTLRRGPESESLLLIGGFSPNFGFLQSVWEFDLATENWTELETFGNGPLGVYGHSTVYHVPTASFYVFGGYTYAVNRTFISNKLYTFHYPSQTWSVLPTFEEYNPPRMQLPQPRFLHTAVTTDEFLLVFGGRSVTPTTQDSLIAYSYACNQWIRLLSKDVVVVGNPPPATYAHAMALDPETTNSTVAYVMGGFAGGIQSHVTRISLPSDLCRLWTNKDKCRSFLGCSYCAVISETGNSTSYCYSNSRGAISDPCRGLEGTHKTNNGVMCNREFLGQRTCEQYTTCTDCLARWPSHWDEPPVCKWCGKCSRARCVPATADCDRDNKCRVVTNVTQCAETQCAASDCNKCHALGNCLWTRQAMLTTEQGVKVTEDPIYDWSCVTQEFTSRISIPMKTSSAVCPARCSEHKDCDSCLTSQGAEGGWHECHWSVELNECVAPSYQPLYCAGGTCGLVLSGGSNEHCPQACKSYKQCSTCLRHAHCGWCSLDGTNSTGQGVCYEGSLDRPASGPEKETCDALYSREHQDVPETAVFSWHYVRCPPENECENGHHSCDAESEQCVDLPHGYKCVCGSGYRSDNNDCVPVCPKGCVRGTCVAPDHCRCDFGYVGANCSIQCQCNGHSECEGPDRLDRCVKCHNNTQGPQCQHCRPLYVGDPTEGGECVPCVDYCNGHTHVCVNESVTEFPFSPSTPTQEIIDYLGLGPTTRAKCVWCGNHTMGEKCQDCMEGFFRGSEDHRASCRPCECHGHGDTCDPITGEKCNCANNTESDPTCQSSKNSHHCWALQCSKCRDSYFGTPTDGHQCYKQMNVDYKFCLDAKLIEDCKTKLKPLAVAQTVFFMVQPRFMNVDIRLTVDVTQGGLDLFVSPRDDTFVVDVNMSTGAHTINMDTRYIWHPSDESVQLENENGSSNVWHSGQVFNVMERQAKGLTTFITLGQRNTLLFVRNLTTNRLVLTLPEKVHELGSTRFYIAVTAVNQAYGTNFFPPRPASHRSLCFLLRVLLLLLPVPGGVCCGVEGQAGGRRT